MNKIIYIDGKIADLIGGLHIRSIGEKVAELIGEPVDILVHGISELHADKRFVCKPPSK